MKKILNHVLWGIILFPFFISMYYVNYFPLWLLFGLYILIIGALSIYGSIFSKLERIEKKGKRIYTRIILIITGIGLIVFFSLVWATSYMDIGNYISKNYNTVKQSRG